MLPVVVRYPRYHGHDGTGEIRRVETPAEPHLEYGRIDALLEKVPGGDRGEDLEVGQGNAARESAHPPDELIKLARGYLAAADANALVQTEQVRRVVGADGEPISRSADDTYVVTEPFPFVPATRIAG